MSYKKQNFADGQKLKASHLNHMEDGIEAAVLTVNGNPPDENGNVEVEAGTNGGSVSIWSGKKFVAFGTSITWACSNYSGGYLEVVKNRNGFASFLNAGVSGAAMANNTANGNGINYKIRNTDISGYDLVLIECTTNDFKLNVSLGEVGIIGDADFDTDTFCGALRDSIEYILSTAPAKQIMLITDPQRNNAGYDVNYTNSAGHKLLDYVNALHKIAALYGLPVCDWYRNSGFNALTLGTYTSDGLHPNATGYTVLGNVTASCVANMYSTYVYEGDEDDTPGDDTEKTLVSISATYSGGDVAAGTAVTDLTGIVVTATYSDGSTETVTNYSLSGTIAEGSNTITVTYEGATTTFTVTGIASEAEPSAAFVDVVTAYSTGYIDSTGAIVTDYATNWRATDYIAVSEGETYKYIGNTTVGTQPLSNVWGYDADKNPVQELLAKGDNSTGAEFTIPSGISYIRCGYYYKNPNGYRIQKLDENAEITDADTGKIIANVYINDSNVQTALDGNYLYDEFIDITSVVVMYTPVYDDYGSIRLAEYDENKNFIKRWYGYFMPGELASKVSSNCKYIKFGDNKSGSVVNTLQLATINGDSGGDSGGDTGDDENGSESGGEVAEFSDVDTVYSVGYLTADAGAEVSSGANWRVTHFIPVSEGQTYKYIGTTNAGDGGFPCVCAYDGSGNYVQTLVSCSDNTNGIEFTIPSGVMCIRCTYYIGASNPYNIQVHSARYTGGTYVANSDFVAGTTLNASGVETTKSGGGVTDYIAVTPDVDVYVYNIIPNNGGRVAMYDANKVFASSATTYEQNVYGKKILSVSVTDDAVAYIRISCNVMDGIVATVNPAS